MSLPYVVMQTDLQNMLLSGKVKNCTYIILPFKKIYMYTYTGVFTWNMSRRKPRNEQEMFPVKSEMAGPLQCIV